MIYGSDEIANFHFISINFTSVELPNNRQLKYAGTGMWRLTVTYRDLTSCYWPSSSSIACRRFQPQIRRLRPEPVHIRVIIALASDGPSWCIPMVSFFDIILFLRWDFLKWMPLSTKGVAHCVLFHNPSYTDLDLHRPPPFRGTELIYFFFSLLSFR